MASNNIFDRIRTDGVYIHQTNLSTDKVRYRKISDRPIKLYKYSFLSKLIDVIRLGHTNHLGYQMILFIKDSNGDLNIYTSHYMNMDFMKAIRALQVDKTKDSFKYNWTKRDFKKDSSKIKLTGAWEAEITTGGGSGKDSILCQYQTDLEKKKITITDEYIFLPFLGYYAIPFNFTYTDSIHRDNLLY